MAVVLVVNSGSSSLKYQMLCSPDEIAEQSRVGHDDGEPVLQRLVVGRVEQIGSGNSRQTHHTEGSPERVVTCPVPDLAAAVDLMSEALRQSGPDLDAADAVGHRIVHGGDRFTEATLVDDEVEQEIERLSTLAPLHNPPSLEGLRRMRAALPHIPHVAVFDTAFHATMPPVASTYAIPADLASRHGVRRYGFHGTSVGYVARQAALSLGRPLHRTNLIVCHLGNGASVTAVEAGRSVDTSMGMTPLEGLVMGTRSGDLDPAVVTHLTRTAGLDADAVDHLLNFESGMLGLCGESDVREIRRLAAEGDRPAAAALDVYAYRLRKYVGGYLAVLPRLDGLVFTGGIGEHDAQLRSDVVGPLQHLGLRLDADANGSAVNPSEAVRIDDGAEGPAVLVVPTDEEVEIAAQVLRLLAR